MIGSGYLASFIAHGAGKALFIGLYKIESAKPITFDQYWQRPANIELKALGMRGFTGERPSTLWFELPLVDFYKAWKGKLVVDWPPPERSWWRRAHRNDIAVHAILEDSALDAAMKHWREIDLTWSQLRVLPSRWKAKLSEWRAIYYIFDASDGKGYVGSAYTGLTICSAAGSTMRRPGMVEIGFFVNATPRISASRSWNECRRTWTPTT